MLGSFGFYSAKGMVAMPNLSGLTKVQAESAITAAGLNYTSSSSSTGNSGLDNSVASQGVVAGALVDYDSEISFVYYTYVSSGGGGSPSPPSCTVSTYNVTTDWSPCNGGYKCRDHFVKQINADCSETTLSWNEECQSCTVTCTSSCSSWSAWGPWETCYNGVQSRFRTRTCTYSDCTTNTEYEYEQQSCGAPSPGGGCTPNTNCYLVGSSTVCCTPTCPDGPTTCERL